MFNSKMEISNRSLAGKSLDRNPVEPLMLKRIFINKGIVAVYLHASSDTLFKYYVKIVT